MRFFNRGRRFLGRVSKKVHPFFLGIILILLCSTLRAEDPNSVSLNAYYKVLELQFTEAHAILANQTKPDPFAYYVANLADAIELFITEDPALYEYYEKKLDQRVKAVEEIDKSNPYRLFVLGELRLQTSMLNAKFGEELSSVWNLRKAYFALTENQALFPEFDYTLKSLGVLHILLGTVPEKYYWILNLLKMEGTVQQGIGELKSLMNQDHTLDFEVHVIFSLLQSYIFEEGEDSLKDLQELYNLYPDNLLLSYVVPAVFIKNSRAQDAESMLPEISEEQITNHSFYLFYYLRGETALLKGDYEIAIVHFNNFLKSFRGKNFVKDVHYKIFLCYHLMDQKKLADKYFRLAQTQGNTIIETDKFAARMVNQKEYPNQYLMRLRLATDGGYYKKAQKVIEETRSKELKSLKDKVEFAYRRARLLHKTGKLRESITFYEQTLETNQDGWYFGANSALQLGYIYLEWNQQSKAKGYFEKATNFKRHEYKNSIDNKAIAALKSIDPNH